MDASLYQERFWLEWQLDPASPKYNEVLAYEVKGPFDLVSLNKAVSCLLKKHVLLRSQFYRENGRLQLAPIEDSAFSVDCVFIDALSDDEQLCLAKQEAYKPFDLKRAPLWRVNLFEVGESRFWLIFTFHHIILDGNAFSVFLEDFAAYYNHFAADDIVSLNVEADDTLFKHQIQAEQSDGPGAEASLGYYTSLVNQDNLHFEIQKNSERPSVVHFTLEKSAVTNINAICAALKSTPFRVMTALFSIFLYKSFEKKQFCLTYPVDMRANTVDRLLGSFINLQLIPVSIDASLETFKSLLSQVSEARRYAKSSKLPYEKLIEVLRKKCHITQEDLPNLIVSQTNLKQDTLPLVGVAASSLCLPKTELPYDISFEFEAKELAVYCKLSVNNHHFHETFYQDYFKQQFQVLLDLIAKNMEAKVIDLMPLQADSAKMLADFSCCSKEFILSDENIYQAFCRVANSHKQAIAVIEGDNKITYENLLNKVNHIANNLQVLLDDSIDMVGVTLSHGVNLIAILLALFKVGKSYLPLRPDLPAAYVQEIIGQSGLTVVILDQPAEAPLSKVSYLDANALVREDFSSSLTVSEMKVNLTAYVLYTSGTTGVPKGVVVQHKGVVNLIKSCQPYYKIGRGDVVAWFHSYAFDFSVWEIWSALLTGGAVYVVTEEARKSPAVYTRALIANKVTIINKTPSSLKQWGIYLSKKTEQAHALHAVRLAITGGEALFRDHVEQFVRNKLLENCKLYNMYGITEDCIHSTIFPVTAQNMRSRESIIGKLLPGKKGLVVNQSHQPKAVGQVGEFLVSGFGVAEGYFLQPGLTRHRFVELPDYPGIKWLKTGDKVRLLPSGDFEYIGRTDTQIKVRGYRVDYKDIEVRLNDIVGVLNVKVIFDEENLLAFLKLNESVEVAGIMAAAKNVLPVYMLPNYFFVVDNIPCNANNKVDIMALLKIAYSSKSKYSVRNIKESDKVISALVRIWQSLLSYHNFDITDNFFDCGGNSLLLLDLQAAIEKRFSVTLPILEFFRYTTVKDMAKMVEVALEKQSLSVS